MAQRDEEAQIVADLARLAAPTMYFPSGRCYCALCQMQATHHQGDSPLDHEANCPWRRAKVLADPANWGVYPGDHDKGD